MNKVTILALLPLFFFGCSRASVDDARQLLVGQWKYDTEAILNDVGQRELSEQERIVVQGVMAVYKDAVFSFNPDSTLVIMSGGITQYGSWAVGNNGKSLTLNLSGQDQVNTISELGSGRIILAPNPERGIPYSRIFIPAGGGEAQE